MCGYRDTSNQIGSTKNFDVKVDMGHDAQTNERLNGHSDKNYIPLTYFVCRGIKIEFLSNTTIICSNIPITH